MRLGQAIIANPASFPSAFANTPGVLQPAQTPNLVPLAAGNQNITGFPTPFDLVPMDNPVIVGPGQGAGPLGATSSSSSSASLLFVGIAALIGFLVLQ